MYLYFETIYQTIFVKFKSLIDKGTICIFNKTVYYNTVYNDCNEKIHSENKNVLLKTELEIVYYFVI